MGYACPRNRGGVVMSLYDDIQLALSWLNGELPLSREKEARAATRKVLGAVSRSLGDSEEKSELYFYLHWLAKAFDPSSVPNTARHVYTRKAYFKDTSQGAKAARAALSKHIEIATLVGARRPRSGQLFFVSRLHRCTHS